MGYIPGLRQPVRLIRLRFTSAQALAKVDWKRLDETLERCAGASAASTDESLPPLEAIAQRILGLAACLLQASRIPVFEAGRVLKVETTGDGTAQVVAQVPVDDTLGERYINAAYQVATQLVTRALASEEAPLSAVAVQEELLETFVEPMRNRNPGGKSSIHILRGAMASDIPFVHVGGARYCLGWGSRCVVIHRSGMSGDSRIGAAMAQSKSLGTRLLRQAGLPAPQNVLVENVQQALDAANTLGWPVVIKPDDRDRGEGVTTDIHDEAALNTAFDAARKLSQKVLVEEQLRGICHRVAIVHGRLLYAVTRFPKRVLGDGVSSIRQLVEKANEAEMAQPPWNRKKPWPLDGLADAELQQQGLDQGSIPMAGRWVTLRPRESSEWGGDATDITDSLHPANVSLCERAARLFGLDVAGIDFMSEDPTLPWHENGAAINEVNFAPLMGGGEASRTRLPELWRRAFPAGARIPVFAVIGNAAARRRAEAIRQWRSEMGERCCLTDHEHTLGADGSPLAVSAEGLFQRCRALLLDRQVDSLVLVVHNDELLRTGSPVDRYSAVEDLSGADPGDALNKDLANRLLELLAPMQAPGLEAH